MNKCMSCDKEIEQGDVCYSCLFDSWKMHILFVETGKKQVKSENNVTYNIGQRW